MSAEFSPRPGDRVLLAATIQRLGVRDDKTMVCTVQIDECCLASIRPEHIHSVVSQKIRAGDRVCWKNTDMPRHGQALNRYGKVLYVEAGNEEEKRPEMALVAPEGGYRDRPYLPTADFTRVIPALVAPEPEPLLPTLAEELAGKSPLPPGVYWDGEAGNFYDQHARRGMGTDFYRIWVDRRQDFPTKGQKP